MSCGCCACLTGAGQHPPVFNRPGLSAIHYRIGTHRTFLEAMIRRLTVPVMDGGTTPYSLHRLTTRETDDPAIALLDAWACVGDILTFYQERIANEAYLATATERRSILELGRLVGYTLKPGVSASVYLAYTLDEGAKTVIPAGTKAQSIPGADEKPQMFETSYDTEARAEWNALKPRMRRPQDITLDNVLLIDSVWIEGTTTRVEKREPVFFVFEEEIIQTIVVNNDPVITEDVKQVVEVHAIRRAREVIVDDEHKRTCILLERVRPYYIQLFQDVLAKWLPPNVHSLKQHCPAHSDQPEHPGILEAKQKKGKKKKEVEAEAANAGGPLTIDDLLRDILLGVSRLTLQALYGGDLSPLLMALDPDPDLAIAPPAPESIRDIVAQLVRQRSLAPASPWKFGRALDVREQSDLTPRLLAAFFPQLATTIYTGLANISTGAKPYSQLRSVHLLRRQARVFGHNAPTVLFEERPNTLPALTEAVPEQPNVLHLASSEDGVAVGSYVVVFTPDGARARKVQETQTKPRGAYGVSGDSTRLVLNERWWCPWLSHEGAAKQVMIENLKIIRNTSVLIVNEPVTLAQQILDRPIGRKRSEGDTGPESETRIELDTVVNGLAPGRYVVVTGERSDTGGTRGIIASELAMIANIEQQTEVGAGGTSYSILELAPQGLAYEYARGTVKILGNIVHATNGETHHQILGGGDASKSLQTFGLNQSPLAFISAPTIDGVQSTLVVRVNDVRWHLASSLAGEPPNARVYVSRISDEGKVAVTFGTGREGARLPTGTDNVRASYRSGIGRAGNVRAGQIATAVSRPLGVSGVINPIEAAGGADPESRDDARRTIPVSLQALGRIVSIRDYADFARTFAGISKASSAVLSDGRRRVVYLTIGGADDIEIPEDSDLYRNLVESLRKFGDPYQPLIVKMREKIIVTGAARVRVHPDYLWTSVAPKIQAALLDTFSYDRRELGQPIYPAEVIATIQRVAGVSWVDLDILGGVRLGNLVKFEPGAQRDALDLTQVKPILPRLERSDAEGLHPAEIAYLPPKLADLFILTEIPA